MALTAAQKKELKESVAYWTKRRDQAKRSIKAAEKWKARALRAKNRANGIITRRHEQLAAGNLTVGQKIVKLAKADVGVVERPDGSNWGGKVEEYLKFWGFGPAAYSGAAYRYWAVKAGVKGLTSRVTFVPFIVQDARAGRNGFKNICWERGKGFVNGYERAPEGSAVCFDWEGNGVADHVGVLEKDWDGRSQIVTDEANTFSDGSGPKQGAGNGVWHRSNRSQSDILAICVPKGVS
jgi:hypothetical protein